MHHKQIPMVSWRLCLPLVLLSAFSTGAIAQNSYNWNSLGQLKTNDRVSISFKDRSPLRGPFRGWTADQVTVGDTSATKEEVLRLERYRAGGWSRGKTAAIGALIGFGGGFTVGAAAGGGCGKFGPCFSRGATGAVGGAFGAVIGGLVGAALPHHTKELIYAAPARPPHR